MRFPARSDPGPCNDADPRVGWRADRGPVRGARGRAEDKVPMGDSSSDLADAVSGHRDAIYRYIRRIVGDATEAEDLTQETLVRAHEKLSTLESETRLTAWLYRIATNLCYDRFRSASFRRRPASLGIGDAEDEESPTVVTPQDETPRLDLAMEQDEMGSCVRRYLDGLSDSYRAVILLHDVQGLTNARIAEMLGTSLAAVKIKLHRARERLKAALENACDFTTDDRGVRICEPKRDPPQT